MFGFSTVVPWRRIQFLTLATFFVLFASHSNAAPGDLLRTIDNPDPQTGAHFGYSVDALNGDLLVGAPLHNTVDATGSGIAYRFTRGGDLVYAIQNPIPSNNDQFGLSIRGYKKNILIGAPFDEVIGAATGGAVHFAKGGTGKVLRSIASPAPLNNSRFGWDVFVLKGKFVAGAPGDNGANDVTNAGAAYLLNKGKAKGHAIRPRNPKRTFLSPRGTGNDQFGYAVSAMQNVVLIGAPGDDTLASNAGAAFSFFARNARLEQIYENPEPGQGEEFGFAVAVVSDEIDGNDENEEPQVAVGAPSDVNPDAVKSGRVFVFDSATGALQLTLEDPNPANENRFGAAVHNADGNILVGAPGYQSNSGIAYLFNGQTGQLMTTLNNPEPASNEEFGFAVNQVYVKNGRRDYDVNLLIGAPKNNVGTSPSAGSIYLFEGVE